MESEAMGRWFEVDAFRVGDPEERKVALLFSDITERKQAEAKLEDANRELKATNRQLQQFARLLETKVEERVEALHQSEQKYRRLFEEAPVGIAVSKPDGTIMDVNATAVEILGYDRAELLSMNASELHAEPGERLRILSQLADNPDRVFELRMQRKSGEEIIVRSSVNMRQGPGGAIIAYQGFFQDISDGKRAKEALEESEAMFRALAEESPTGIAIIQGGRFCFVNQQYADIFGYEREEMVRSLPVLEVVHPEDRHIVRENLRRRIDNEVNAVYFEVRGRTKKGETIYIEVHGARFDYAGQPAVIGSVLDVTERKRLQREVLNMQEAERQRIGHDLHDGVASQLTGVGIMLASLKRSDDVGRDAASRIEEIRQLIEESTEKIRLLSHGLAPTQLSQGTLGKALKRLTDTVDGGRCELAWSEEGGFDEGTRDGEALGENAVAPSDEAASHLYWIAREAVTNAQKHADASAITVRLRREDNTIVLEIEDDGQGFDPDGVDEGRLGLRTMRYRAELMNGTLQIDTTPGEGTCVTCRLPAP
jgi:PAS domain S-box-containing protein